MAALDPDFLLSDTTRGVRFMLEYAKAEEILRTEGVASTIVVFGGARIHRSNVWYEMARAFGELVSRHGGALAEPGDLRRNVIATGGGSGIMEAANRGADDAGAVSIGFNISLPHAQPPNVYVTPELCFNFHYFAMRKMHFMIRANALVVFPGGFGTLDELFEVVTLRQTEKAPPIPVVLVDEAYWRSIINFDALASAGMIAHDDLQLLHFADSADEAWRTLLAAGVRPYDDPSWRSAPDQPRSAAPSLPTA